MAYLKFWELKKHTHKKSEIKSEKNSQKKNIKIVIFFQIGLDPPPTLNCDFFSDLISDFLCVCFLNRLHGSTPERSKNAFLVIYIIVRETG